MLDILVTMPQSKVFDTFFDEKQIQRLKEIGNVHWNTLGREFTQEELCENIENINICIIGWNSPIFDETVLQKANCLQLIAHTGGSIKPYITNAVYQQGIKVISGNQVFSTSVAEGVIAYALAALRQIPKFDAGLKQNVWPSTYSNKGLLNKTVGVVGYGMVARSLVSMLKPFHCKILVNADHMSETELKKENLIKAELQEIFTSCDVVTLHCGMTEETYHLVNETLLSRLKQGALFINTARGAVIDEKAFCKVFKERADLQAVLDVYEQEPLPSDTPLTKLPNVITMPHMAGPTTDRRINVTENLIDDIQRFLQNKHLQNEISQAHAVRMSTH